MTDAVLCARDVHRRFLLPGQNLHILRGVDLTVRAGEMVALRGVSGSGKSTLLHLLAGLDIPDAGETLLEGRSWAGLTDAESSRMRRRRLGLVFQFHHLLSDLDALENTALPLMLEGVPTPKAKDRAVHLLGLLGLGDRLGHLPATMSGGERQRVALARALVHEPAVVLADEPTGNLDRETGGSIVEALRVLARENGQAVLVATHDLDLASRADRVVYLSEGRIGS